MHFICVFYCVGSMFCGKDSCGCVLNDLEFSGYLSDDGSPRRKGQSDLSVFRDAVQDCLDYDPKPVPKAGKLKGSKSSNDAEVEKYSGLLIRSAILYLSRKVVVSYSSYLALCLVAEKENVEMKM